jgi:leucyl/phenylalanyl-tRNA--protein transferase
VNASNIHWISADDPPEAFPDIANACREPDGLLAAGGDLSARRLLYAYQHGIFPWYDESQVVLWWSPDPRCVLQPDEFHVSRRLQRYLRKMDFEVSFNRDFIGVIDGCAASRGSQQGTWITHEMTNAYCALHKMGWAHSVEIWHGNELVGGLYGLAIGRIFFGESMFSRATHASKIAMLSLNKILIKNDFLILDCQVVSPHLLTLGAKLIARQTFRELLDCGCNPATRLLEWPKQRISARSLT